MLSYPPDFSGGYFFIPTINKPETFKKLKPLSFDMKLFIKRHKETNQHL